MITILGAQGFVGTHLVRHLEARHIDYYAPRRGEELLGKKLGHVIYCIGLTGDFRARPHDAVEAHACNVLRAMRECEFESFVYLSSTRLYKGHRRARAREEDDLRVNPSDPDDLYNLSKALGESITLLCGERARVVRLSNVYGDDFARQNFLSTIIGEALETGTITLQTTLESAKDYVSVNDAVALLPRIALSGRRRSYNVASGVNVTNAELVGQVSRLTGCRVTVEPDAATLRYPTVDISRIRQEFGFAPASVLHDLPRLIDSYRQQRSQEQ